MLEGSATATESVEPAAIPYREDSPHGVADLAVVLAIVLLAMAALVAAARWLQQRGRLPGAVPPTGETRLIDTLRLGRGTTLSIVEHRGNRIAVVDSPRGVAISPLPDRSEANG